MLCCILAIGFIRSVVVVVIMVVVVVKARAGGRSVSKIVIIRFGSRPLNS